MSDFTYIGSELDLFAKALKWKRYWLSHLCPFVAGTVIEVGAGNGNNTRIFQDLDREHWICVEPDPDLCVKLRASLPSGGSAEVVVGTLADVPENTPADTILYLDVLEHIEIGRASCRERV